jgi:hypothetical protein
MRPIGIGYRSPTERTPGFIAVNVSQYSLLSPSFASKLRKELSFLQYLQAVNVIFSGLHSVLRDSVLQIGFCMKNLTDEWQLVRKI